MWSEQLLFTTTKNICFCNALSVSTLQDIRIEEPGLLGCCTVWMGNLFPAFRRNVLLSSSAL